MSESRQYEVKEETVNGKPRYIMTVPIIWRPKPTIWERLRKQPEPAKFVDMVFDTTVVGVIGLMAGKINLMPNELYGDTPAELALDVVDEHRKGLIEVVALSYFNRVEKPDKSMLKFIEMNFTFDMLMDGIRLAIAQMQLEYFLKCIMLVKGTSAVIIPRTAQEPFKPKTLDEIKAEQAAKNDLQQDHAAD